MRLSAWITRMNKIPASRFFNAPARMTWFVRMIEGPDGLFLEHLGRLVRLDDRDRIHLTRMTPLGRKVYIGRKGKLIRAARKEDSEAELLLAWSRMPAREWAFPNPA